MFRMNLIKKVESLEATKRFLENEKEGLEMELQGLRKDIDLAENKRKIEEEDLKHMIKMAEERNEIKLEKKVMENDKQKAKEIADVKDKYRDKLEKRLQTEVDNIKEMYGQILERLPTVTARLKGEM